MSGILRSAKKFTRKLSGNNNLGFWTPAAGGQRGFGNRASKAAAILPPFSKKIEHFKNILVQILLKIVFLNDCNVC